MNRRRRRGPGHPTGPVSRPVEPAPAPEREPDPHAKAVVEARLGREARDVLEATVVLEAWTGTPANTAMSAARDLVNLDGPPPRAISNMDPFASGEQSSVLAEGLTLVLLIVSIAAWANPIGRALGPDALPRAIRVALPIAVAMQWGLRSRYLGRPQGMALLARDGLGFWAILLAVIDAPLIFLSPWGPIAAMLIPIWVGGAILTRRGWGPIYAAVLVVGTVALSEKLDPYVMLGSLTAITLLMCVAAVRTRRQRIDARAGSVRRAVTASLIGGLIGLLLVGDPSLGWGVHGTYPAVALIPSVIGSYWGGYYLWNFYDAVPRGLRGTSLKRAGGVALSDPAMSIFVGAMLRLLIATVVLSARRHFGQQPFGRDRHPKRLPGLRLRRPDEHVGRDARGVLPAVGGADRGRSGPDRRVDLADARPHIRARRRAGGRCHDRRPALAAAAGLTVGLLGTRAGNDIVDPVTRPPASVASEFSDVNGLCAGWPISREPFA